MARIIVGDSVRVLEIPAYLSCGLPLEDQHAIQEQVGKILTVLGFNQNGEAELEFMNETEKIEGFHIHTIWLAPHFLEKVE
jgi:hypothetical protein